MRILALGDIHGCSRAFDTLMATVAPQQTDKLITLGDYTDRGPDSKGILNRMLALHKSGILVPLLGNHDITMLQARTDRRIGMFWWRDFGGDATMESYARGDATATWNDIPPEHWDFLQTKCFKYYETDTHFFVHANADPNLPLEQQPDELLFWERFNHPAPHYSGKIMVCGHTHQQNGLPLNLGHAVCIDTWVYGDGWLTCLDVKSGKIWQANQAGERREGWLEAPPK
ncbi:MAG: serine/threonine protein phosphatase [Abitibacteriaceae bacterium]|nr:serine/threonine protein phosphatase [Abditibacteriaceae bacterium]